MGTDFNSPRHSIDIPSAAYLDFVNASQTPIWADNTSDAWPLVGYHRVHIQMHFHFAFIHSHARYPACPQKSPVSTNRNQLADQMLVFAGGHCLHWDGRCTRSRADKRNLGQIAPSSNNTAYHGHTGALARTALAVHSLHRPSESVLSRSCPLPRLRTMP